jgi:hypothetical protein
MLQPTAEASSECGLVIRLTTDEYFGRWKNGSGLVFVPIGEDLKVFNTGFITFDPRENPEPSWQMGRYWLLVNMRPPNCVNEAHLRLELVRDAEVLPQTVTATPTETTPAQSPRETPPVTTTGQPAITQEGGPGTSAVIPSKAPLPGYLTVISAIFAVRILGWKRKS